MQEQRRNQLMEFVGATPDYLKGVAAGVGGMPGDFEGIGRAIVNARMQYGSIPTNTLMPTSDDLGGRMGADTDSGGFIAGTIGTPDMGDIAKLGVLGVGKIASKARKGQKSFYMPSELGDVPFEVIRNPSKTDISAMQREGIRKYGPTAFLRETADDAGNKYYWQANEGIHMTVEPRLQSQGINILKEAEEDSAYIRRLKGLL